MQYAREKKLTRILLKISSLRIHIRCTMYTQWRVNELLAITIEFCNVIVPRDIVVGKRHLTLITFFSFRFNNFLSNHFYGADNNRTNGKRDIFLICVTMQKPRAKFSHVYAMLIAWIQENSNRIRTVYSAQLAGEIFYRMPKNMRINERINKNIQYVSTIDINIVR